MAKQDQKYKKIWSNFRQHLITEYENLLAEVGVTTLGQEGYRTVFNATEATMDEFSITESIVRYAERAKALDVKVQALEDRLNQLKIGNHQPPPQISYYEPESMYYTLHHPESGIPPTINIHPPYQHKWVGQATFQQQGKLPRKRVRNRSQQGGRQTVQFIYSPNIVYQHPAPPYQAQQPMGG